MQTRRVKNPEINRMETPNIFNEWDRWHREPDIQLLVLFIFNELMPLKGADSFSHAGTFTNRGMKGVPPASVQ